MAIFGKSGLSAAAMYVVLLYALYGTKNSGFRDSDEIDAIGILTVRKGASGKQSIIEARARNIARIKEADSARYGKMDTKFEESYGKKAWLR